MYKENDRMNRMIRAIGKSLTLALFGEDMEDVSEMEENGSTENIIEPDMFEITLHRYVREGNINEAENILMEELEQNPTKKNLMTAVSFYEEVAGFGEETLEQYQYSKEEIDDGLAWLKQLYAKTYQVELKKQEGGNES